MIGLSPDPAIARSMALSWGVDPLQVDVYGTTDEMVWFAVERTRRAGLIRTGDTVLVLAGAPSTDHLPGGDVATDVLRIVRVH